MSIDIHKKLAGILIPVFALRTANDFGIGDTEAVKEAIDFCHQYSLGILQLLPINETGGDNSPYNAISSMALEPAFIHIPMAYADDKAQPNESLRRKQRGIIGGISTHAASGGEFNPQGIKNKQVQSLNTSPSIPGFKTEHWQQLAAFENNSVLNANVIDYPQVKSRKNFLLQKAFAQFESKEIDKYEELKKEFESFKTENKNWLADYTIFRTLVAQKEGNTQWTAWEDNLRNIESAKQAVLHNQQWQNNCNFYAYVQWVAHRQWSAVKAYADQHNVQLIGDIPFGVSRYSADVFANRNLFDLDWSGGAPPERFFKADLFTAIWGQNWGIPLYNWQAHEKENYAWWRCRIKQVTKYFHGFRLDHVLGFFRIYAFPWQPEQNNLFTDLKPEQASQITGGRLPQFMPGSDETQESALHNCQAGEARLKVISQAAGNAFVIAEDLGLVPNYVRPVLKKLVIPGYTIPIFERNAVDHSFLSIEKLPALSLATYGTHDNDPLASYYEGLVKWWHGEDGHAGWLEIQKLMRFLSLDENHPPTVFNSELTHAFFNTLLHSPCWLAILMITDLLGTKQRFNLPGTSNASNWSQRLEKSLAEYAHDEHYAEKFNYLRQLIVETNRQPAPLNESENESGNESGAAQSSGNKFPSAELPI